MKKIIVGQSATGKSRNYVAPAIREHNGSVIYITNSDDRAYLGIDDIVEPIGITKDGVSPVEGSKILIDVSRDYSVVDLFVFQMCMQYKFDTQNVLLVIDEAGFVLGDKLLDFLLNTAKLQCDIMIVLQNMNSINSGLNQLSTEAKGSNTKSDAKAILDSAWEVVNVYRESSLF